MTRLGLAMALLLGCTSTERRPPSEETPPPADPPATEVIALPMPPAAPKIIEVPSTPPAISPSPAPVPKVPRPVVYYIAFPAYAEGTGGWVVDSTTVAGHHAEAIEAAVEAFSKTQEDLPPDQMDPLGVRLEPGTDAVPPTWDVGDTWTLVTRKAVLQRKVTRFSANQGAGELHFEVMLGTEKTPATKPVLAIRGSDVDPSLRFVLPERLDPSTLGDDPIPRIKAAVLASLKDDEAKVPFLRMRAKPKHVAVYPGRFPGGRTALVVLDVPLPDAEQGESEDLAPNAHASAMMFLRADGTFEVVDHGDVHGWITPMALLDGDDDDLDDVFYEDAYYEGSYIYALRWRDGAPRIEGLTGDGA